MFNETEGIGKQVDVHPQYHEAVRRASQSQPFILHKAKKSILLTAPNNIIFELINTIVEEENQEKLMKYIESELRKYLKSNWDTKTTKRVVARLRREQTLETKAGKGTGLPLIVRSSKKLRSPKEIDQGSEVNEKRVERISKEKSDSVELNNIVNQVYDQIMWRINHNQVTQVTHLIIKLFLEDAYKKRKLTVKLYDDVAHNFKDWRSVKLIKLYSFGNAPANDQRLILASTDQGDMTQWIANYIDGSEKKQNASLIKKLSSALRDKTNNCIYITNELDDAVRSLSSGVIRCVFLLDRELRYESLEKNEIFSSNSVKNLIISGKLYVINSLDCIEFANDPTTATCC